MRSHPDASSYARPWQALGPSVSLFAVGHGLSTTGLVGIYEERGWLLGSSWLLGMACGRTVCLASLPPNPKRPRLAAHFCSPWSWVSLGSSGLAQLCPTPSPSPSWQQLTLGGGVEAGLPPGPLPPGPAFQGWAAWVHCWAGNEKQWLPLEEVGIQRLPTRVHAGARES